MIYHIEGILRTVFPLLFDSSPRSLAGKAEQLACPEFTRVTYHRIMQKTVKQSDLDKILWSQSSI